MTFDTKSNWGKWRPNKFLQFLIKLIDKFPVNNIAKRIVFLIRKPVKYSKQYCFDLTIWGLKLRLCNRGNLTEQRWITMPKFHDTIEREFIASRLKSGGVFLDIGANAGFYTFWVLSKNFANVSIFTVEPSKILQKRLLYNLRSNHLENKVTLLDCALTKEKRMVNIIESSTNLGETKVARSGNENLVQGYSLQEIIESNSITNFQVLKIDIEGEEFEILSTFFKTTSKKTWPQTIVCELIGKDSELLKSLLRNNNYELVKRTKLNGIFFLK